MTILPCPTFPLAMHSTFGQNCVEAFICSSVVFCIDIVYTCLPLFQVAPASPPPVNAALPSLDDIESKSFSPPTDDNILEGLESESFSPPTGLVNAPGGTVRYLAFLLRSLSINVTIELTPEPRMRFHSMEDADRLRCSHGEVTTTGTLDYNTGLPIPGGLFCERIFGPTKNWECSCGKYKGE